MLLSEFINKTGYYRIKVVPNQPNTELKNVRPDGTLKIALTSVPEKGQANKELVIFLSKELKILKQQIRISSGLASRLKVVFIDLSTSEK